MSQPADWGARVQRVTDDARDLYARALRRYDELLRRVSSGELPADEVQRQFRDYLQQQAPASTRTMVESSVALLAGLLHLEAQYRDALVDGLVPAEAPPPPPPDPSSIDPATWYQALSRYAAELGARAQARNQRLVERVATGQVSAADVQQQGRRYLEQAAPHLLGEVMALGVDFVEQVQRASAAVSDGLYDQLLGPEPGDAPAPEPPLCLDLQGPAGSTVSTTLVFENARAAPATVTCRVSDFTARAGGARFAAPLDISPDRLALAPGQRGEVGVRLTLATPPFTPGDDYAATLIVDGVGESPRVVQILARATPSPGRAATPAASATPTRDPDANRAAPTRTAKPTAKAAPKRAAKPAAKAAPKRAAKPAATTMTTPKRGTKRTARMTRQKE